MPRWLAHCIVVLVFVALIAAALARIDSPWNWQGVWAYRAKFLQGFAVTLAVSAAALVASTVIGGVSLFGGVGTVVGTFLGLLLMQVIRTGLVTTGVNTHWQTVAVGVIMILAVGLDLWRRKAKIS